jgi:hypothetical protein
MKYTFAKYALVFGFLTLVLTSCASKRNIGCPSASKTNTPALQKAM